MVEAYTWCFRLPVWLTPGLTASGRDRHAQTPAGADPAVKPCHVLAPTARVYGPREPDRHGGRRPAWSEHANICLLASSSRRRRSRRISERRALSSLSRGRSLRPGALSRSGTVASKINAMACSLLPRPGISQIFTEGERGSPQLELWGGSAARFACFPLRGAVFDGNGKNPPLARVRVASPSYAAVLSRNGNA